MPESIAVIGCGPGGMFFCHAMETKRQEMQARGESIEQLPGVKVFERAPSPGGVWRSERNRPYEEEKKEPELSEATDLAKVQRSTQMYEALWTNGPKEGVEFFDYTFDDHFKRQLPVYVPRHALLEYMMARVTRKCPDFFEKYVEFQTSVINVVYGEDNMFHVTTQSAVTGVIETQLFDRCIWAAGDNGEANMPLAVLQRLEGFRGKIIHSTDTGAFKDDVCGKRVLVIGGSYSAEDLALMSVKLGVERIFLSSRSDSNAISWTKEWPQNKVEVLLSRTPVSVSDGSTVVLQETRWVKDDTYELVEDGEIQRLENIDTIILCTGYNQQFGMLEEKLRSWHAARREKTFTVPSDWKSEATNDVSHLKHVHAPKEARFYGSSVAYPDIYRGMLIENPKMMFHRHDYDDYNILNHDAMSWAFVKYVTGELEIPSTEEMRRQNEEQALFDMKHFPIARLGMDADYGDEWRRTQDEHDPEWDIYEECTSDFLYHEFRVMARTMKEGGYPVSLGTYHQLNENGEKLYEYGQLSYYHRRNATAATTFRDAGDPEKFTSLFTGTPACPLKKLWMDIDENMDENIV